jgi:hypothetical protein
LDVILLIKSGGRRTHTHQRRGRRPGNNEPAGEGGPDEAAAFIVEAVAELAGLARRHKLDMLASCSG